MKAQPHTAPITRCTFALAALMLGACSMSTTTPKPASAMIERHGQVQFSSASDKIVGEIAIKYDEKHFHAEITKGPGVPLLTISSKFTSAGGEVRQLASAHLSGPLVRGSWTWREKDLHRKIPFVTHKLKDPSHAWAALPEVFMWGEDRAKKNAKDGRDGFIAHMPDIVMHARVGNGEVKHFDYSRLNNPKEDLWISDIPPKERKKLPVLETVICHLD